LNIDNTRLKKSAKSGIKVFLETQNTDLAKVQEHEFKAWDEQYLAASTNKSLTLTINLPKDEKVYDCGDKQDYCYTDLQTSPTKGHTREVWQRREMT
jgi:hypothetical protein